MSRPLLLILDGQSLKSGGVEAALTQNGWEVAMVPSAEAVNFVGNRDTALLLMDPALSGEAGLQAVQAMRAMDREVPVVLLKGGDEIAAGRGFHVPIPGVAGSLERSVSPTQWATTLNGILASVRAEKHKFTAEELFADILADIDGPKVPAPAPQTSTQPFSARLPEPPPPPPPQTSTQPFSSRVPQAPPLTSTQPFQASRSAAPKPAPAAPSPAMPDLFGGILAPLPGSSDAKPASPKNEFTLSGISGIKDPFGEASSPMVDSIGSDQIEFVGSSDHTPAARSKVMPPPPARQAFEERAESEVLEEFGNYYLLEKIAVGGMAELFKARQRGVHNFEKIVAIKRILPHLSDNDEFVRMFIDEAKLAAQLTHPNIVQIFDLGKASGFYYIAMEYVDGKDLRSLLRKVREYKLPFPEPVAAFVTMKVAGALDYAHRKKGMNDKELKLVHRDISPQNVLISGEGAVKLVDFGIAKAATKTTQTVAGALKGKLLYMSPEQALGQPLDSRSDIYSLGLVLFELLTGERCFQADSELGVLEKVRLGKAQDVRTVNPMVSREMAAILDRALQKNVDQRYPSARFLERDLKALLARAGNEPVEHDIAEYVNTLLRGTKEQVETLIAAHFPPPPKAKLPELRSAAHPILPSVDEIPTTFEARPLAPEPVPLPPQDFGLGEPRSHRWLLPTAALILAVAAILLWLVVH
jgi:serine/threonine protein kinase/CheY-like chemotaxis protein